MGRAKTKPFEHSVAERIAALVVPYEKPCNTRSEYGSTENHEVNVPEAKEATWWGEYLEGGRVVGVERAKGGALTDDCSGGKALPEPEG